jgi:hypothetical protein
MIAGTGIGRVTARALGIVGLSVALSGGGVAGQEPVVLVRSAMQAAAPLPARRVLPFAPGEVLVFRAKSPRFGEFARATMRVEGPIVMRGTDVYRLVFELRGKVLLFGVSDLTRSWLDPERMTSLRYSKEEHSPLGTREESVDLAPAEGRWTDAKGKGGELATATPLDELSYLYYIRTLPLADDGVYTADLHYDVARNPVTIAVVGRERITVPAGEFDTIIVEMRVNDRGRFGGEGTVRLNLTTDAAHVPVRIESSMPVAGKVTLELSANMGGESD